MVTAARARIDELIAFHADLSRYSGQMEVHDQAHRAWRDRHRLDEEPRVAPELEHLRQDLLRRSGAVRPLFTRHKGRIIQPGPFHGPEHDAWDLALVGHPDFYQAGFAKTIADHLNSLIGELEANPSLLDAPEESSQAPKRYEQMTRIAEITAFQRELLEFANRVEVWWANYSAAVSNHEDPPGVPEELESTRQELVRRGGKFQGAFERVIGKPTAQRMRGAPPVDLWVLALHAERGHPPGPTYMRELGDYVGTLVGRLESEPSLLDPPRDPAQSSAATQQTIHVHPGATANIGQTDAGNISQRVAQQKDLAAVRQLLVELQDAIRDVEAPEGEIEGFLEPVERLDRELVAKRPLMSRLTTGWSTIQGFAAIEGAWQGWERVQRLSEVIGPKLHDLIQVLAAAGPH